MTRPAAATPVAGQPSRTSRLLQSLAETTQRFPTERKLLVCRDRGEGRELLRALARLTGGWMGWEAATVRDLAGELALVELEERGLRILDEVETAALVDQALDAAVDRLGRRSVFRPLAEGAGFRQAVADAVADLRLGGVTARRLREATPGSRRRTELAEVVELYARELAARGGADVAAVFEAALSTFEREWPLLAARAFLVPGVRRRGLPGRLLEKILEVGAVVLDVDPVRGLSCPVGLLPARPSAPEPAGRLDLLLEAGPPREGAPASPLSFIHAPAELPAQALELDLRLFRAASPATEVREAMRRALEGGGRWDDVEIAATDPVAYGAALDALAAPNGIPVTFGVGLPLERSRVGRLLRTYLTWVERGFQARTPAEALARGELRPPRAGSLRPSGAALARRFRELRIGWGRDRYAAALASLPEGEAAWRATRAERMRRKGEEEPVAERSWREAETRSLEILLRTFVEAQPAGVSDAGVRSRARTVAPAALAAGALRFLGLFEPRPGTEEAEALERLRARLTRLAEVSTRSTTLAAALAELRNRVRLRIPRPGTRGPLPWTSAAGAVHLTDVLHAGRSGRARTFVVGLDAERVSAGSLQDPVLPDADREALRRTDADGPVPALATAEERAAERRWEIAAALASLRGTVTLSHAAWEAATGSALAPSAILVQALRVLSRDARASFEALDARLGEGASRVPRDDAALDATDVWLAAVAGADAPRDGTELVRRAFQGLDAGLSADAARGGEALTAFHGFLPEVDALAAREAHGRPFSPSELGLVGRCPLAWLYRYGLGVKPLDEPEHDPGRWLTEIERGNFLHRVFERFGRGVLERGLDLAEGAADVLLAEVFEAELARAETTIPAPSPVARDVEVEQLRRDARLFLEMERDRREGRWLHFELPFGRDGAAPAAIRLPDGRTLLVHGVVDRVDELPDGRLLVVDYKTGKPERFERSSHRAPFDGGRQIQPGIYVEAVTATLGRPVAAFQYRFPTERGQQHVEAAGSEDVEATLEVTARLLETLAGGRFLATNESSDCRFCDYKRICRVSSEPWELSSPRAEWSRDHGDLAEYATMLRLRTKR